MIRSDVDCLAAVTARNAIEVEKTRSEIAKSYPDSKVIGIVADGCKHSDLEMLVQQVSPCAHKLLQVGD